jgi:hypothetical protein
METGIRFKGLKAVHLFQSDCATREINGKITALLYKSKLYFAIRSQLFTINFLLLHDKQGSDLKVKGL